MVWFLIRGPLSDAECLFKFHEVDLEPERDNPYNAIHLNLPAVTTELDDIYHFVDRNREWRRLLRYVRGLVHSSHTLLFSY